MIGRTIRHYTIEEIIGQGGMGEVYRATDTKLRKSVALKFLPEATAQDETARKRLLREARAAAQLDHPYICHVYEVGEVDGIDYIVMEYVSGQTLGDKLKTGLLPVDECLRIASEIAEALDNAQQKGIIHRDLKPRNIMLTRDDHVKLMDFGSTKTIPVDQGSQLDHLSEVDLTKAGFAVGTPAYMSPEQLRQRTIDSRSDIFALGITLYEMLAGKHPFLKGDVVGTMSAILRDEPRPVALYREGLHPVIQHIVRKMLAKDPKKRYQSAREIHTDLVAVMNDSGALVASTAGSRSSPLSISVPLWLVVPILVLAAAAAWSLKPSPLELERRIHLELIPEHDVLWNELIHPGFAVSPDGNHLVFREIDSPQLQVRDLRSGIQRSLVGSEAGFSPFFSPDGSWVGFVARTYPSKVELRKVPFSGGGAEILAPETGGGADWASDGRIVIGSFFEPLRQLDSNGTNFKEISEGNSDEMSKPGWNPVWLPEGAGILCVVEWRNQGYMGMAVFDPATKEYKKLELLQGVTHAAYAERTGHLVYNRLDRLFAVPFDLETLETLGPEVSLGINGVLYSRASVGFFSLSDSGTLVYLPGTRAPSELVRVNLDGEVSVLAAEPDDYSRPRLSPDGRQIQVVSHLTQFDRITRVVDSRTGLRVRVDDAVWMWMPDGENLLSYSEGQAFASKADGTGQPVFLFDVPRRANENPENFFPSQFSFDDQLLIARTKGTLSFVDFRDSPLQLTKAAAPEGIAGIWFALSPDGRWVAYSLLAPPDEREGFFDQKIWVSSFPEGHRRRLVADRGLHPLWSPDGRIYFWVPDPEKNPTEPGTGALMYVETSTGDDFEAFEPRLFLDFEKHNIHPGYEFTVPNWDLSKDGKHFVMVRAMAEPEWTPPGHFKVITGFHDILLEKVPVNK